MSQDIDFVDSLVAEWFKVIQLDLTGLPVIARIVRMSHYISKYVDANFDRYGLNVGEFEVLAALTRHPEEQMSPKELQKKILISSGGLSNIVNRLEAKNYITRAQDPKDRRGVIVRLTESGRELALKVVATHVGIEADLVQGLNAEERTQLAALLKKLILSQKEQLNEYEDATQPEGQSTAHKGS